MTENVKALLQQLKSNSYKQCRGTEEFPTLYPVDFFGFHLGSEEQKNIIAGNIAPNYKRVMTQGFDAMCAELTQNIAQETEPSRKEFGTRMLEELERCTAICDRYREVVKEQGNERLYRALLKVPRRPAETFFEACVFLSLSLYFMRASKINNHIVLGRFDQYMLSFFEHDLQNGVSEEELFETLEAFFISLNFDLDIYFGLQQGDSGQSMVLGGFDLQGNSQYNRLTELCLDASLELNLIDPKINLRVGKNTPFAVYQKGTQLTKKGLGFPQYCNDDVVIPGLIKLGYAPEDAADYAVAACWEYIIPCCGAEVPNRKTMNFPLVVRNVMLEKLPACKTFEELMQAVEQGISAECDHLLAITSSNHAESVLLSIYTDSCLQNLKDMWHGGAKYQNFGCHGAGIANATDALAAVKTCVYDEQSVTAAELLRAMECNFEGFSPLRNRLRSCPKLGNNDPLTNEISCRLMSYFSKHMNHRPNGVGGIWRAGTGSAMDYILKAKLCPATADGRMDFEPYSSSFSPSLDVKANGILSILQSFTQYDMTEIINGGPLTLEIHDSVLKSEDGMEKTARLVETFIRLGGHQLQLNSINRDRLLDAQKHPENHPDLIVRVWGWSGYFNELDTEYQNHIIRRTEYLN